MSRMTVKDAVQKHQQQIEDLSKIVLAQNRQIMRLTGQLEAVTRRMNNNASKNSVRLEKEALEFTGECWNFSGDPSARSE